ncbi:C2 calcium-dependent membrane targeting [Cynara cardunculus var. scolymus]|uniref:C2 calcium-dependent membrane targeting n=1 Tax=Cynara cardunculus var. scolymus TaxID=59895 RepID=A0A103XXV9_CYNCS|nr:C2 calcium-dependent membrane targeting [Cynara cardunculus var. scolymus]
MRLYVYVLEGKNWEVDESFVKLRVGKSKSRTRVLKNTKTPIWNEEFAFRVHSLDDQLTVSVHHHHHHEGIGFLKNGSRNLVGRVRIPLWSVAAEENHHLPPTWFSIETHKSKKSINQECGKILVALSLHGRGQDVSNDYPFDLQSNITDNSNDECDSKHSPSHDSNSSKSPRKMMKSIVEKLFSKHDDSAMNSSDNGESTEEPAFTTSFEDSMETMESTDEGRETPENLQGGVLIDETYVIPPKDLNHFIFAPDSQFRKDLAAIQGTTDVHEGPWTWESDKMSSLTRTVTYTKAASKLVKASKVTEEQTYVRASGIEYAVFVRVNTPDVPYGNTFRVELLYKITRVPELGGDETSRIIVSWRVHFNQSTMMKGMIEGGAKQGLKESFDQFSALLAERFKLANPSAGLDKDHALASLQNEHQSDWELAVEYFCNFMVISTVFMVLYTVVHILLCEPPRIQGLEFNGLELPDSFGNDHGVKAQGEGWVLTVALIEGTNLAPLDSSGFSDPYVVLTCNGKTRTSSVKLQTLDPRWNEEPPSLLDVEVFDFDGPFGQPTSLGHSEIRFLRHTAAELADMWVPLDGKLAQSFQSKLHLRIFLDNTNGVETIKEYLTKVEKEAGKKGRLFVSSRIVGFYANFFGHKTKFSFLWEDVEDIQVLPPSLASVGSPILVMVLHKDRGVDARHGAKSQDEQGRHRFYFHSFVSMLSGYQKTDDDFEDQHEQDKADDFEDQHEHDEKGLQEDVASHLVFEDAKMSKIYSVELPFSVESTMEIFKGGNLEQKVMGKLGCLNYNTTNWEPVYDRSNVAERRLCYKLNRRVSSFGGDVMCTQQKTPIVDGKGWIVTEAMCLRDVPFGDHFYVQVKYKAMERRPGWCGCDVFVGVAWLKSCGFEQRISRNVVAKLSDRVREMLELMEREILLSCC